MKRKEFINKQIVKLGDFIKDLKNYYFDLRSFSFLKIRLEILKDELFKQFGA